MLQNFEPFGDTWLRPERFDTITVFLRRLELVLEFFFLTSYAVTLAGLLVNFPGSQPLVRLAMPLGISYAVMRRGWAISFAVAIFSALAIFLFPKATTGPEFFALAALPVWAVTGWAYKTHQRAVWRWVGTVLAMASSDILIAMAFYPHWPSVILKWSTAPIVAISGQLALQLPNVPLYWPLWFILEQVLEGTAIFLVLAFFADLAALPLPQVPRFGTWVMPKGVLGLLTVLFLAVFWGRTSHLLPAALVESIIILLVSYAVVGVNVLWGLGQIIGVPKPMRVALLLLLAVGAWVGVGLLTLIGIYDSLWDLRQYVRTLRRSS